MPTLTIRNLPMDTVERLKTLAKQELLSEMRSRWDVITVLPSASEVSGWIKTIRHGYEQV